MIVWKDEDRPVWCDFVYGNYYVCFSNKGNITEYLVGPKDEFSQERVDFLVEHMGRKTWVTDDHLELIRFCGGKIKEQIEERGLEKL